MEIVKLEIPSKVFGCFGQGRSKASFNLCGVALLAALSLSGQTNVVTQHNDIGRTGQNLTETALTVANVKTQFGKLFTLNVDGQTIAQPLYVSKVTIAGAVHPVVFVATEHDSVYAFDASNGAALWQASLFDKAHGAADHATTVPNSEIATCPDITFGGAAPEFGITGTPVIDVPTGILYVVSKTFEGGHPVQRLHALDITTGNETRNPVTINAPPSLPPFDSKTQNQRAGLLEVSGNIYVAFGSHCDDGVWHGWILGYNAATLVQTAAFITTPLGEKSGIWMSGAGLAADTLNSGSRIFPVMGNGPFDATDPPYGTNTVDYGDDILRLTVAKNGALTVTDQFTPHNQAELGGAGPTPDKDLGSGGAMLLPDQPGANTRLLVALGKTPPLYLVNRDNMGGFSLSSNNIVQEVTTTGGLFGTPAYWNGNIYVWPAHGKLSRYTITSGRLLASGVSTEQRSSRDEVGSTPSISANGAQDGIVWSVDNSQITQVVYAHAAADVSNMLWNSAKNAPFDSAESAQMFVVPTIADGRVFIGDVNHVQVYGLIPPINVHLPTEGSLFFGNYAWTFPIKLTSLPERTVEVKNDETGALVLITPSISGANPESFFTYGDCGNMLAPGQTCRLSVVFNPQIKGNFSATLTLTIASGTGASKVAVLSLSGTGLGPK